MKLEDSARSTILIHYYRAMVGRADIWRTRMDTTTNWAVGTTAAVVSFAWGEASTPHFVVLAASLLTLIFLLLEARRLTFYHLWQHRAMILEEALIRPAIAGRDDDEASQADLDTLEKELSPELGRTIPSMPMQRAVARRLRRVYIYLFAVQVLTWWLKLSSHPQPVSSLDELISRAAIGVTPGALILGGVTLAFAVEVVLALLLGGTRQKTERSPVN